MKTLKLRKFIVLAAITLVATATILPMKASAAWKQTDSGNWSYTDGNSAISGWKLIDGKWYFFDSNSVMKTGWVNDGGKWYYLESSGAMKTGWVNDSGKWYYTSPSGDMQTGWLFNNNAWYYLNTSGSMQTGLVDVNGKTYYLSESGAMKTGNITINGVSYNFAANGEKIDSSAATQTPANPAAADKTTTATDNSSGGAGGSGGGSGSGGGGSKSSSSSYPSLYGTWSIGDFIKNGSLSQEIVDKAHGQQFTISKDSISATVPDLGPITISSPAVKESTVTTSDFKSKWGIGVSGTTVKCVHISYHGYSGDIYITEDGTKYGSAKGSLFVIN